MLLGFTYFFREQSQKQSKFSNLEIFDLGMPCSAHSESKRP